MDSIWLLSGACVSIALGLGGLVRLRTRGGDRGGEMDLSWVDEFSVDKYRPMERLLSERDFAFLSAQPGYVAELGKSLRTERARVFSAYLRTMCADFDRLHAAAKYAVLHSPEGVDLCGALARNRAVFAYALARVRVRLALYRLGWTGVDVRPLICAMNEMTTDIRAMRPLLQA